MILEPQSSDELATRLATASAAGTKITEVKLGRVARLLEHTPEDMTATVEAGMTLATLQEALRHAGQWLPIDPPNFDSSDSLTVGDLLANDLSGSRRYGYGTIRDYVIGIKVALPTGEVIRAGGKVVKNVAGYDLGKLFIGARHTLGIIVEATFKLRPLPEAEAFVQGEFASLDELTARAKELFSSTAEPVLVDAHNLSGKYTLVAAFAGIREDVDAQVALARSIGLCSADFPICESSASPAFWTNPALQKVSVLPSRTLETIASIRPEHFVAHLGNGIIHYRGGFENPRTTAAPDPRFLQLMERVKNSYDPKGILPAYAA